MNKKGFTLIELLGTLIIITLITLIAVPKILDWYNNSTDTYKDLNENLIIESARIYVSEHQNRFSTEAPHTYCISMQEMINYGCLEEENVKGFDKNTYVNTYVETIYNGEYFEYYLNTTCTEK